jgi:hypothetical protein
MHYIKQPYNISNISRHTYYTQILEIHNFITVKNNGISQTIAVVNKCRKASSTRFIRYSVYMQTHLNIFTSILDQAVEKLY